MNILYLAHRIPYPPNKGDKLRAFRQIEHLARRHRVWCAFFLDDPKDARHANDLRQWCAEVGAVEMKPFWAKLRGLTSLFRGRTITEGYYKRRELTRLLEQWQNRIRFDAIVAFSSSMANYALQVSAPRRILDLCDLDSLKWRDYADHITRLRRTGIRDRLLRSIYQLEGRQLAAAELRWIDRFDAAILATGTEAAPLRPLVSPRKIHVIGNGVDLPEVEPTSTHGAHQNPVIGFVGVMDYFPNVDAVTWFAAECWPAIRARFPTATFRIVGRSPTPAVHRLSSIPGIEVVGEVKYIVDAWKNFDVSVAPLRIARGVQNKVLEAMAAAKPVVLSSNAAKGISAVSEVDYLVADSAEHVTAAVCSLLSNPSLRTQIGQSARTFVATHRRWETELDKLNALIAATAPCSASKADVITLDTMIPSSPPATPPSQAAEQDLSAPA